MKYLGLLVSFFYPLVVVGATWNVNSNGSWNVDGNWTAPATFPNAPDDVAHFLNVITQNRTVTLGQTITIGTINFDDNNRYTISGSDSLVFDVTGGTATVAISNANGTHRILCPVILNDSLTVNHGSSATIRINGDISGSGGLTKAGAGTGQLRLQGDNSYVGPTSIHQGTLFYNNDGCIPGGNVVTVSDGALTALLRINRDIAVGNAFTVTVNSNGTLRQNNNDIVRLLSLAGSGNVLKSTGGGNQNFIDIIGTADTTFSGVISGGAPNSSSNPAQGNRILKSGTSKLTLTGANTYTCRTFIQNGAINVQNSAALGVAGANSATYVQSGATLEIENNINLSKTMHLNGAGFSTAGAIHNISGDNTISDPVAIGWSGGAETAAAVTIQADPGTTLTMSNSVTGTTDLTLIGGGTLRFSGAVANTYTGNTIVNGGTLDLNKTGVNAVIGNMQINGGEVLLSQANQIADTANLTLTSGTLNLNGNNETVNTFTFNGGTLTQGGGILTVANGLTMRNTSIPGTVALTSGPVTFDATNGGTALISGAIDQGAATITYAIANGTADHDMEISGTISGSGQIIKTGAGTLLLSGVNPFTGTTSVNEGDLVLNGSLAGAVTVNLLGSLSGVGSLGELQNKSVVTIGTSIGALTVNGNYTQDNNAFLVIEIDDVPPISDTLVVTGNAHLDGAVVLNPLPGIYTIGTVYNFLIADMINGQFDALLETHPLSYIINYVGDTIVQIIILSTEAVLPIPIDELEGNAQKIATYLFSCSLLPSPEFLPTLRALVKLPADSFSEGLLELGPQQFGALANTRLQTGTRIGQSMNRVKNAYDHNYLTPCYQTYKQKDRALKSAFWANPIGYYYKQNERDDQVSFNTRTYGFTTGFSHFFSNHFITSLGTGYTHANLNWFENRGDATLQSIYLSPSVGYIHEHGYLGLSLVGAYSFYSVKRKIQFSTVNETAKNHHRSWDLFAELNGALRIRMPEAFQKNFFLIPTVIIDSINVFESGCEESGAGSLDLAVSSVYSSFLRAEITLKLLKEVKTDAICLSPNLSIGYVKNIPLTNGHYTSKLYREELCQDNFTVQSYHSSIDQMVLGAELLLAYKERYWFNIRYEASFGDHAAIQEGSLDFNVKF